MNIKRISDIISFSILNFVYLTVIVKIDKGIMLYLTALSFLFGFYPFRNKIFSKVMKKMYPNSDDKNIEMLNSFAFMLCSYIFITASQGFSLNALQIITVCSLTLILFNRLSLIVELTIHSFKVKD